MLPHTGLFLLWKVALQMRIRRPFFLNSGHLFRFQPSKPDQHENETKISDTPNRQRDTQKIIGYGAITEAAHDGFEPVKQRPVLQAERPRSTAGRCCTRRQALQPQLISRRPYPVHRRRADKQSGKRPPHFGRLTEKYRQQSRHPDRQYAQTLHDAQYAGIHP